MVAIDENGAVNLTQRGVNGDEVFSGLHDENKCSRPLEVPVFDPERALVTEVGEAINKQRGSRILSWEILPPATQHDDLDDDVRSF